MYIENILKVKRQETLEMKEPDFFRVKKIKSLRQSLLLYPLIAEVKRASPSSGTISIDLDPVNQAKAYLRGGAGAISVLTDAEFFKGSIKDLHDVALAVDLPVLCKDFIVSQVQIEWAFATGADAVLIIPGILEEQELKLLVNRARALSLEILFEVHSVEDFNRIKPLSPEIVGINSRNFKTFVCEPERAINILKAIEGDFITVAESGINDVADILMYKEAGADAFLVGTALVKSKDPEEMVRVFSRAGGSNDC